VSGETERPLLPEATAKRRKETLLPSFFLAFFHKRKDDGLVKNLTSPGQGLLLAGGPGGAAFISSRNQGKKPIPSFRGDI
jgi:hypothetical protein